MKTYDNIRSLRGGKLRCGTELFFCLLYIITYGFEYNLGCIASGTSQKSLKCRERCFTELKFEYFVPFIILQIDGSDRQCLKPYITSLHVFKTFGIHLQNGFQSNIPYRGIVF